MKTIYWRQISRPGDGLHVATIELRSAQTPRMHRHDFYECFLILEGSGQQLTDYGSEPLVQNTLYFVRPEQAHYIQGKRELVFTNIAFERSLLETQLATAAFPDRCWDPQLAIQHLQLSKSQCHEIVQAASDAARSPSQRDAAWLVLSIARTVARIADPPRREEAMPEWFLNGLSASTDAEVLLKGMPELIRRMGRSERQVARCFKKFLQSTPGTWLNQERIQRACLLLTTTRRPVLEIALDCGYESASHFHKRFKQATNTTPLHYRKARSRIQP